MIGIGPKARYTDETVNRFKKTNLLYTTDPYMLFQDPTYLAFKILFEFDQPTSGLLSRYDHTNTAMGYLSSIGDEYRMNYLNKFITTLQNINQNSKLYIVCDKIKYDWEIKYIEYFKKWNPILLQEDLIHDIALIRDSNILIHSNSTLCWIISFLSNKQHRIDDLLSEK